MLTISPIKQPDSRISTYIAFAILPLSGFATDIYVPSMPNMARDLGVNDVQVQSTLTFFLFSFGLSQLVVGSLLDSFGRYKIGLISMVIFSIASFIIALSVDIQIILLMRIIQGITAATIIVAKRAFFVDRFTGDRLKHYLSLFTIIWSIGPIIAPFIGGYLEQYFGWQSNFILLGCLVGLGAVFDWIFGTESLKSPVEFNLNTIRSIYATMLQARSFIAAIGLLSITYSIVMIYNMTGPFLIENIFKRSPVISGYCSLILGFSWLFGGVISKRMILYPLEKKINTNLIIQFILVSCMLFLSTVFLNLATMMVFIFLIHINTGFTYNNYFTYCLARFPKYAAMSGGLIGGTVYILVAVFSYTIVHFFPAKNMTNLSFSYLVLTILSAIVLILIYHANKREKDESTM